MNNAPEPLKLGDYVRIVRRRLPYILVPFLILGLGAAGVVLSLPSMYRSTAKIAVESQQIPADLVRSTVPGSADERIGSIQQLVMTDSRLEKLISKFGLYQEDLAVLPMEKVLRKFRKNISVESFSDPYSLTKTAIAFTVSFDHTDPTTARDVATELADLFLSENSRTRNARATDTAGFLTEEADRLSQHARDLDARVAEFKRQHSDALPEHLDLRVNMLQQVEFDLRSVQREISAAEQERRFLETQRTSMAARSPARQGTATSEMTPQQQLRALRSDLAKAQALYTGSHPDVVRLKRLVANLEAQVGTRGGNGGAAPARDPESAEIESKISTVDTKLSSLRTQESDLSAKMATLQAQIFKTPETERGLKELTFEYESAVKDYESVRSKQQQAELSENLESRQMAERFVLLEPPTVPVGPASPNRLKLMFIGLVLALGTGGGTALAAEAMDTRIRDPQTLTSLLGTRPLAILPYIEHRWEGPRRVFVSWVGWLSFLALLAAASVLAHQYQEPLQQVLQRVMRELPL